MRSVRKIGFLLMAMAFMKGSAAHAQRLDDIVEIIAFAMQHSDAKTVVAMASREGIIIETREGRVGPLGARQASAMLRRLFNERETVSIRPNLVQAVGDAPRRAFGEITWVTRAPDTTQSESMTVYLELAREGKHWRITQIRMLP